MVEFSGPATYSVMVLMIACLVKMRTLSYVTRSLVMFRRRIIMLEIVILNSIPLILERLRIPEMNSQ